MASSKNAKLETEIDALKVRFLEEQEKVIALENYSRRENLRFMNVPEQEGENCANIIYDIVENELNMDVENLQFQAIHRVGKQRSSDETSKAYPGQRYGTKSEGKATKLFMISKRVYYSRLCQSYSNGEESFSQVYVSGPQERYECEGGRQKLGGK